MEEQTQIKNSEQPAEEIDSVSTRLIEENKDIVLVLKKESTLDKLNKKLEYQKDSLRILNEKLERDYTFYNTNPKEKYTIKKAMEYRRARIRQYEKQIVEIHGKEDYGIEPNGVRGRHINALNPKEEQQKIWEEEINES